MSEDAIRRALSTYADEDFDPLPILRRAQGRALYVRRRKTVIGLGLAAAGVGVAVLGGIFAYSGNNSDVHQVVSDAPIDPSGPAIVSEVESKFYPAGEVIGTLELRDDCLELRSGSDMAFPVWPPGATWSDDGAVVLADGHTRYPIGGPVQAGGGYLPISAALADAIGERATQRIQDCARGTRVTSIALIAPPEH
jgi:hypothetical protein